MRLGKAGDAVDQKQDLPPLIAEMFGHRRGRLGRTAADLRRPVRRGGDHDRPGHPLFAQILGHEMAHLAAPFADQPDDDHISPYPAGKPGQQGGFPYTRSREQPDPLPRARGSNVSNTG